MADERHQALAGYCGHAVESVSLDLSDKIVQTSASQPVDNAELGEMRSECVRQHRPLSNE